MKAADSTTVMNNNETKQTHHHYQSEKNETRMRKTKTTTITTTSSTPPISLSTNNNNTATNHNNNNTNEMYYVSINKIVKKETELFLNLGLMNHPGAQEMGIKHQKRKQQKQLKQLNKQQERNRMNKKEDDDSTASTTSSTNDSECECDSYNSNSHSDDDNNDGDRIGETNYNYLSSLLSNKKKKSVQFCEPLITRMKIIDDEEECESSLLFYSEADYEEFRRNAIMDEYHCNDDSTVTDKDGSIAAANFRIELEYSYRLKAMSYYTLNKNQQYHHLHQQEQKKNFNRSKFFK